MLDLRVFLSRHGIEWYDSGRNCSNGFVNINCPFCRNDPSYHLRINESEYWYYCLRNPKHKGGSIFYLLKQLGCAEYVSELNGAESSRIQTEEQTVSRPIRGNYSEFTGASQSQVAVDYLGYRKFDFPLEVIKKFNLRIAPNGRWADRLLIPLTIGWTGRAIPSYLEPRYLAETDESGFFRFGKGTSAVLVEGPIDALKIASVTNDLVVMAMVGGRVSPAMTSYLLTAKVHSIYVVPDSDVTAAHRVYLINELRVACIQAEIRSPRLPEGFKDCGELTEVETRQWLYGF